MTTALRYATALAIVGALLIFRSAPAATPAPWHRIAPDAFAPVAPQPLPTLAPQPLPTIAPTPSPRPTARPTAATPSWAGLATWYCLPGVSRCTAGHPGGPYAAIRRDLVPALMGRRIAVCSTSACVTVTVIDCDCAPAGGLIDLYADAFRQLAPLSRGIVAVTVRRVP